MIKIFFDGGNYKQRICVYDPQKDKTIVKELNRRTLTNNELEYLALIHAIKYGNNTYKSLINYTGDSRLVINQVFGNWKINHIHLKKLHIEAIALLSKGNGMSGVWVKRDNNEAGVILECRMKMEKRKHGRRK